MKLRVVCCAIIIFLIICFLNNGPSFSLHKLPACEFYFRPAGCAGADADAHSRYSIHQLTERRPVYLLCHPFRRNSVGDATAQQQRQPRQTPDWGEHAVAGDHLWSSTSISGDFCYVGDTECSVSMLFGRNCRCLIRLCADGALVVLARRQSFVCVSR